MKSAKHLLALGVLLGGATMTAPANAVLLNVTYHDSLYFASWQQYLNPVPNY